MDLFIKSKKVIKAKMLYNNVDNKQQGTYENKNTQMCGRRR
jgi:hypothetical protein